MLGKMLFKLVLRFFVAVAKNNPRLLTFLWEGLEIYSKMPRPGSGTLGIIPICIRSAIHRDFYGTDRFSPIFFRSTLLMVLNLSHFIALKLLRRFIDYVFSEAKMELTDLQDISDKSNCRIHPHFGHRLPDDVYLCMVWRRIRSVMLHYDRCLHCWNHHFLDAN